MDWIRRHPLRRRRPQAQAPGKRTTNSGLARVSNPFRQFIFDRAQSLKPDFVTTALPRIARPARTLPSYSSSARNLRSDPSRGGAFPGRRASRSPIRKRRQDARMWKIEIATENIGEMHCLWDGEPALEFIRATLSKQIRSVITHLNAEFSDECTEGFKIDELQLEAALDEDVKRAQELISELAPQAFWEAQARIVVDVMLILMRDQKIEFE